MGLTEILLILVIAALVVLAVVLVVKLKPAQTGEVDDKLSRQTELMLKLANRQSSQAREDSEAIRSQMDTRLRLMQQDTAHELEELRRIVGQKLSSGISQGIEGSFKTVSGQLEAVSASIGELKSMGGDINELKRVLGGVKQRGNWGEAQLEAILADILPKESYFTQYALGDKRVDFAVRLPGDEAVLPIDSKFPLDRYSAVLKASESGDAAELALAEAALCRAVTEQAKSIRKYIVPPKTCDFAVMYLPSEAIYSHICSMDMAGELMQKYGVLVAGPSTVCALISAVEIGLVKFAVEQKSEQILALLKECRKALTVITEEAAQARRNIRLCDSHLAELEKRTDKLMLSLSRVEEI